MNNNTSLPLALELPVLFTARNITALTIAEDYYVMEVKRCLTAIEEKIGQQLFDVLEIEYIEILFQHGCILDQTLFQRFQHIKDNLEKQQSIGLYKDARIHSDTLSRLEYFLWAVDKGASAQEIGIDVPLLDHAKQLFNIGVVLFLQEWFTRRSKEEIHMHIKKYKPIKHVVYGLRKLGYIPDEEKLDERVQTAIQEFTASLKDDIILLQQLDKSYEYYKTKSYCFTMQNSRDKIDAVQSIVQRTGLSQEEVCSALKVLCEDASRYYLTSKRESVMSDRVDYNHVARLASLLTEYGVCVDLPTEDLDAAVLSRCIKLDVSVWSDKEAVSRYMLQDMITTLPDQENFGNLSIDLFLRPLSELARYLKVDSDAYYKDIFSRINESLLTMIAQDETPYKRILLDVYNTLFSFLKLDPSENYTIDLGIQKDEAFYRKQRKVAFLIQLPLREEQVEVLQTGNLATFDQTNDLYSQALYLLHDYQELVSRDDSIVQSAQDRLQKTREALVSHIARQRLQQNNLRLQRSLYSDSKTLLSQESSDLVTTIISYYKDKIPEMIKYDMQQLGVGGLQGGRAGTILLTEDIIYMQEVVVQWLKERADSIQNS